MKISTKGRYALRVMADLAFYETGSFIPLKDISERQGISIKYLEQIMRILSSASLVESARGSSGGYRLVKKANEYTVKEILVASEGSLALLTCVEDTSACERCQSCLTNSFWKEWNEHIIGFIEKYTLEDIVKENTNYNYII